MKNVFISGLIAPSLSALTILSSPLTVVGQEASVQKKRIVRPTPTPIAKSVKKAARKKVDAEIVTPSGTKELEATVTTVPLATPTPIPTPGPTPAEFSDSKPTVKERAENVVNSVGAAANSSNENRANTKYTVMAAYSPFDLVVPSKIGGSIGFNNFDFKTYEVEYLGAKLSVPFVVKDLGGFSDRRFSVIQRSFNGRNSFNFHYGISYFDTEVSVGNEYLSRASNRPGNVDLLGVRSLGLVWGLGNRWNFGSGFTIGVDWFSWAQPLLILEEKRELLNYFNDGPTKDSLKDALDLTSYIPRLSLLKIQMGWSF